MMPVKVFDRIPQTKRQFEKASRYAIDAAAARLWANIRDQFQDHYTSGAFRDTLKVRPAIRRSRPVKDADGNWFVRVGIKANERNKGTVQRDERGRFVAREESSKSRMGVGEIALAWELGHYNIFMRQHVRVQIWEPTARDSEEEMQETFARVMKRYLDETPSAG